MQGASMPRNRSTPEGLAKEKLWNKTYYENNKQKFIDDVNKRRREKQRWFKEIKRGLKCTLCPETHPACLQFHHKDRKEKEDTVCRMVLRNLSKDRILAEIAKCEVLCSNCHFKLHDEESQQEE
jgi:cytochrome c556